MLPAELQDWLRRAAVEMREENIEPHKRPFEAMSRYSTEFSVPVRLGSELSDAIFQFFEARSKPGAFHLGSLYKSVFYFDSEFWPVHIPIIYGNVSLDARECLHDIPETVKDEIFSDSRSAWNYVVFWADCVDYALGTDDLFKLRNLDPFGLELLEAGDQELRAILTLVEDRRTRGRAVLACRMAVELFLKSFLALKEALTRSQARKLSHDLEEIFGLFIATSKYPNWDRIRPLLTSFPPVDARYEQVTCKDKQLWDFIALAQSIGTVICREHTDRNLIAQVLPQGVF